MKSYNEILSDVTKTAIKIPQSDYLEDGKYRIFDQGKEYSVGFSNDEQGVVTDYPYIIFGDHTRVVKYVNEPCFIGADGVKLLKVINKDFNPRYVYYNILAKPIEAQGYARHFKFLKEIQFTEKPLADQQKIAAELDTIQSAIDKKKQQLALLDEAVKSKFVEMFGENPVESGKWKVEKLGKLCSKISDGVHAKPEYQEKGMPFISVVNMNKGILSFEDCKFVSVEAYEKMIKSTNPEKGDVLYTKVGATYGISALVDTDKKFCLYVSVALLKPIHDLIDSVFLTKTMMMPYVKHQADNSLKGIGVPDLHLNQIRSFKIAVPPLSLQNKFAAFVQQIDKSKSLVKGQIADLQELLDSKMQEYFGE